MNTTNDPRNEPLPNDGHSRDDEKRNDHRQPVADNADDNKIGLDTGAFSDDPVKHHSFLEGLDTHFPLSGNETDNDLTFFEGDENA